MRVHEHKLLFFFKAKWPGAALKLKIHKSDIIIGRHHASVNDININYINTSIKSTLVLVYCSTTICLPQNEWKKFHSAPWSNKDYPPFVLFYSVTWNQTSVNDINYINTTIKSTKNPGLSFINMTYLKLSCKYKRTRTISSLKTGKDLSFCHLLS